MKVVDSQKSAGPSRTPKKPWSGRGTPSDSATTGFAAKRGTNAPKVTQSAVVRSAIATTRPAPRLTRVQAHTEAQKSILAKSWRVLQIKLFDMHAILLNTISVESGNLCPPVCERSGSFGALSS
jgi:hypothetical protein